MHTDPAPTLLKENVVIGHLPSNNQVVIVVESASIVDPYDVREQPWSEDLLPYIPTAGRFLKATNTRAETITGFTLDPIDDDPREQLLHGKVTFPVHPAPAISRTSEANFFRITIAK